MDRLKRVVGFVSDWRPATMAASIGLMAALGGCIYPNFFPPTTKHVSVPFVAQAYSGWCGYAVTEMWSRYRQNPSPQNTVRDWMFARHPALVMGNETLSPEGVRVAVDTFVGPAGLREYYEVPGLPPAGARAIADQRKSLEAGEPTAVIIDSGLHVVLLVGASWHKLDTAQPYGDYVWYHDPDAARGRIDYRDTIAHWVVTSNAAVSGTYYQNINLSGVGVATRELEEFNVWGGTYYGDPAPPSCCEQCECGRNRMTAGQQLSAGEERTSPNRLFRLIYQSDGNLVLYRVGGGALWASGTGGRSVGRALMQSDGNFVVYNASGTAIWNSRTYGHSGAYLIVTNAGDIRVVSPSDTALWTSPGTAAPTGRWKSDGNGGCYWDANDSGPDQCTPPTGRWKSDGNGGCYWDPNDSGADQCTPSAALRSKPSPLRVVQAIAKWLVPRAPWEPPTGHRTSLSSARASIRPGEREGVIRRIEDRRMVQAIEGGQTPSRAVGRGAAPYPHTSDPNEVIENLCAGIEQTRMASEPGSEGLRVDTLARRVRNVDFVRSLSRHPDYYLVSIVDDRGKPYAMASVGIDGLLLSVGILHDADHFPGIDLGVAEDLAFRELGRVAQGRRRVHTFGTVTSGDFQTLVELSDAGGTLYVRDDGTIFEEGEGEHGFSDKRGHRSLRALR